MLIGLITDVHNQTRELSAALALFRERSVDQVVTIGDTCDAFSNGAGADEVVAMLADCGAVGVWGNHDFTLCHDVNTTVREYYSRDVLAVMARMVPRLSIGSCHFSHMESSVDPYDVAQLWSMTAEPLSMMDRASLAFAAVDARRQFVGHYHRWWAATPGGPIDWSGDRPLRLAERERYFIVVAAVCDGWCAVLDTERGLLEPLRCAPGSG